MRRVPLADVCQVGSPVCTGRPHHRHHVILRSQGGHDGPTLDACFSCHDFLHAHPALSYERGWLQHGWSAS